MTLERTGGRHSWTSPSGVWWQSAPFQGLEIPPLILGAVALSAVSASLGAWLSSPSEDWSDNGAFKDRARRLHTEMLTIQCAVGGASTNDIRSSDGRVLCVRGTKTDCVFDENLLLEWRGFLANYATFWKNAEARTFGPSSADAAILRQYVVDTQKFVGLFQKTCKKISGKGLPDPREDQDDGSNIPWSWIIGGGLGVVAVLALLRTPAAPIVIQTSEALERGARRAGAAIRRRF